MQAITTVGLDIAKSVFQVHGVDAAGKVIIRRQLKLVDPAKIEHGIDPSDQMIGWNHIIEMKFVEELPLTPGQPTHHRSPPGIDRLSRTESCFAARINAFCNTI